MKRTNKTNSVCLHFCLLGLLGVLVLPCGYADQGTTEITMKIKTWAEVRIVDLNTNLPTSLQYTVNGNLIGKTDNYLVSQANTRQVRLIVDCNYDLSISCPSEVTLTSGGGTSFDVCVEMSSSGTTWQYTNGGSIGKWTLSVPSGGISGSILNVEIVDKMFVGGMVFFVTKFWDFTDPPGTYTGTLEFTIEPPPES